MQRFVDNSSSIHVIDGARNIKKSFLPQANLINPSNPLVVNSSTAVKRHINGSSILTQEQITTFLASSGLLHTQDGWIYLSHAIESLLSGAHGIALHLAYYAELRSSMSFLASDGIGVFDHQHLSVDRTNRTIQNPQVHLTRHGRKVFKNGNPIIKNSGTHQFVWDCIEAWSNSTVKPNNNFLKIFSVQNKTFNEWISAFPFSVSGISGAIVKKWLVNWNSDVQLFRNDRRSRNLVSYSPQKLSNLNNQYSVNEVIKKLNSFWQLIEPESSNKFHQLDKYLLKILLQELYLSLQPSIKATTSFEDIIKTTFSNLGLTHDQSFIDFLKNTNSINHDLFIESSNDAINSREGTINPLSVIARAILMLRISTGSTSLVFSNAGVTRPELNFLWERIGVENGFWEPGSAPEDFNELWDNIKDHIDDVYSWVSKGMPNLDLATIYGEEPIISSFNYFKQFHRASLWGMAI